MSSSCDTEHPQQPKLNTINTSNSSTNRVLQPSTLQKQIQEGNQAQSSSSSRASSFGKRNQPEVGAQKRDSSLEKRQKTANAVKRAGPDLMNNGANADQRCNQQ